MPTLCLLPDAVLKIILQGDLKYSTAANPTSCSAIPGYGGNWRYAANFRPGKLLSGRLQRVSNGLAGVSSRSVETTSRRFGSDGGIMPPASSFEKCASVAPEQMHILEIEPKTDIVARSERKARRSAHDQGGLRYPCLEVHD